MTKDGSAQHPANPAGSPLIFLIAGEHSGDLLGASLMQGLLALDPDIRFAGVGGPAMQALGFKSQFAMDDLSVMGLVEVLPRLPLLIRRINQTVSDIKSMRPDCVVSIDAPDFCFRVAKKLRGQGIPLVHYVAPSVWAWRPGRAKKIAGFLDHLLALLPFEPPYFEAVGLKCSFVGHPVLESDLDQGDPEAFRTRHKIPADARLLCMLPGSRRGEIERLFPVFCETVILLKVLFPNLHVVIPTVSTTCDLVKTMVGKNGLSGVTVLGDGAEKADAFSACEVALAASGTVALELAFAGVPAVISYKLSPLTAFIARLLLKISYYSLINLTLDRLVTPEHMQVECRTENLVPDLSKLFTDQAARQCQLDGYEEALVKLGKGSVSPGETGAKRILETIRTTRPDRT